MLGRRLEFGMSRILARNISCEQLYWQPLFFIDGKCYSNCFVWQQIFLFYRNAVIDLGIQDIILIQERTHAHIHTIWYNNNKKIIQLIFRFERLPSRWTPRQLYVQGVILICRYTAADRVCNTVYSHCVLSGIGSCLSINSTSDPK